MSVALFMCECHKSAGFAPVPDMQENCLCAPTQSEIQFALMPMIVDKEGKDERRTGSGA